IEWVTGEPVCLLQRGRGGDAADDHGGRPTPPLGISCFNEAAAVMPRMTPWERGFLLTQYGFNEAAAVMPRMTPSEGLLCVRIALLQRGRGGDAADDCFAGAPRRSAPALQRGRGGDAADDQPPGGHSEGCGSASTRPRR